MKIYSPEEILKRSRKIPGGFLFVARDGTGITMATGEAQGPPLADLAVPNLLYLDVEIYILPYIYRWQEDGQWTEHAVPARAGDGWIAFSPKKPGWEDLNYRYIVWHELGHQFHYQVLNFRQWEDHASPEFLRYMNLRGIQDWRWGKKVYSHSRRAEEVFADDFAHIVGGIPLEELSFLEYAGPPSDDVQEYIFSFIPREEREEAEEVKKATVCIDPGHGGEDRTNRGPTGYVEADGVLDIAMKVRNILKDYPVDVIMTREKDETVSLAERVTMANKANADIFVSIHTNAAGTPAAEGIETYHSIFSNIGEGGHKLAMCIQEEVCRATNRKSRGIKTRKGSDGRDYYYVIRRTRMPAVIVECGFHTNPVEEHLLKSDGFRLLCAQGIARGILRYFDIPEKKEDAPVEPEKPKADVKDEIRKQVAIAKMAMEKIEKLLN